MSSGLDSVAGYGVDTGWVRTGEVAERAGVHVETLRYYERRGLLAPPARSPGGYRTYPASSVGVVRFIKRAQDVGFSLDDILELLHLARGGPTQCDEAQQLAHNRLEDLNRRIADLTSMRDALAELVQTCEWPAAQRECPLLVALDPSRDEALS